MTFTSIGYGGTVLPANWAALAPRLGEMYSLGVMNSLRPTVASGDRRITLASGTVSGQGILDTFVSETVTFDAQGSGVRYDTVVVRRTWATKVTSLVVLKGTSTKAIATTRQSNPGVVDDQPIALVRITAGSTVPFIEADLRCWVNNGGALALHELALSYLDTALGAHVRIGTDEWVMQSLNGTTWGWVKEVPQSVLSLPQGKAPELLGDRTTQPVIVQAGTTVQVSDASGFVQFDWGTPFPNGLLGVVLTTGDRQGKLRDVDAVIAGADWPYAGDKRWGDRTGVIYRAISKANGDYLPRLQHRVNWIAVGF